MRVDLYTDAGVSNDGRGTWGCVAVINDVPVFEAKGKMRRELEDRDTCAAELQAAANGLHKAIAAGYVLPGYTVRIICDNSRCVSLIRGRAKLDKVVKDRKPRSKKERTHTRHAVALDAILKLAADRRFVLTARGVKGHQKLNSKDPHAPHNRRADKLCREARA
jgi:ribonuclease HI